MPGGRPTSPNLRARLVRTATGTEAMRILTSAGFLFACRVAGAASVFGMQILLARTMGAHALGIYVYAFSWCMLLAVIAGLGLPSAAPRFFGRARAMNDRAEARGFMTFGRRVSLASSLAIALLGAIVVWLTAASDLRVPLLIALAAVPLYVLIRFDSSVSFGMSRLTEAFLPEVAIRPFAVLILVAMAVMAGTTLTPTLAMVLQFAVMLPMAGAQAAFASAAVRGISGDSAVRYERSLWLRTAISLLFVSLYANYFLELALIVGGQFLDSGQLAVYNAGLRIAFLIAFGINAVDSAITPRLSHMHAAGDISGMQRILDHAARLRFAGAVVAAIVLVTTGESLLSWFGASFVAGYGALLWLTATLVVVTILGPAATVLSLTGHQRQCLLAYGAGFAALLILNAALIRQHGINGAAFAVFVGTLIQSLILNRVAKRDLGLRLAIFSAWRPERPPKAREADERT
jgi:O-antigen/teichoic acid export membrane protein